MNKYMISVCMMALGTAACGNAQPDTGKATNAAHRGAPKPTEGYDWAMRVDEDDRTGPAILAYEVADTDDQPLNFACEQGGGRIFAEVDEADGDLSEITLQTGDQTLHVSGKTERAETPLFRSEEIAGNSAFIEAFAANGWLRMSMGGHTTEMAAASPKGARAIADFAKHCNRTWEPAHA